MNFSEYSRAKKLSKGMSDDGKRMLSEFLAGYDQKSEAELMDEIIKTAKENRANGTLSNADIDNFYAMLAPMLSAEQRAKLTDVAESLKKI